MLLFDTHCHLQDERLRGRLPAVLRAAESAGVRRMACCGSAPEDWPAVREICALEPRRLLPFFGVHPLFTGRLPGSWRRGLELLLGSGKCGVGEIGLDFTEGAPDRAEQERIFAFQLELAREMKRPVSIHCRKAFGALLGILERAGGAHAGCVLHSYSGSAEMVPAFEAAGLFISFSGAVAQPGNIRGPKAARAVSEMRLLLETDSPDIAPPGGAGEPQDLVLVAEATAAIRGATLEQIAETATANAERAFAGAAAG